MNESKNPYLVIKNLSPNLHKMEKRIASYILESGDLVSSMTISQLAAKIDVAESSIVRFCKIAGYSGFTELKLNLARHAVPHQTMIYEDITEQDNLESVVRKVFSGNIRCLQDTLSIISTESMSQAVEILQGAKTIAFYGVGSSAAIANDSYYRFMRMGFPAVSVTDPHMCKIHASLLDSECAAILITHTGRTRETYETAKAAKEKGARVICVTSFLRSPIAALCDVVLAISSRETQVINEAIASRIAHITILDSIFACLCMTKYEEVLPMIKNMNTVLKNSRL